MATENYLDIDFRTFIEKQKEILKASNTFKDYNYEGSNISVLIELLAYQMELNTYYQNQIAKNMFLDTANIYSTVHRLASLIGYNPKGHISTHTTLTVTVSSGFDPDDQLYVPAYTSFSTEDGLNFLTTKDYTFTIPSSAESSYSFEIGVKEGSLEELNYLGSDMLDNQLFIPEKSYDHDNNESNNEKSIRVLVNDDEWTRIDNFYNNLSGLEINENVYTFNYTKNRFYTVSFTTIRNYPNETDRIKIYVIVSNGDDGTVGSNTIVNTSEPFVQNLTQDTTIPLESTTFTNLLASSNGANSEPIGDIKVAAQDNFNSQLRCVTKNDFRAYLETRNDIKVASVWGEQEETEDGNVQEYNKIHISVIPDEFKSSTISTSTSGWSPVEGTEVDIVIPYQYSNDYKNSIKEYIEPRKIMNSFEIYNLPYLVYFYFEIGLRVKSLYNFSNVLNEIKDKLIYYFSPENRKFNEVIDFRDVQQYIKDTTKTSPNDSFSLISGINSLTFRDIITSKGIYDYGSDNYPQYNYSSFGVDIDNILRPIKLGFNQFPAITKESIVINNEG